MAGKRTEDKPDEVSPEVASRRAMGKTDYPTEAAVVAETAPGAPGQDPDSLTRERKTREAADLSRGQAVADAGEKRADAGQSRLSAGGPAGRTASPHRSTTTTEG